MLITDSAAQFYRDIDMLDIPHTIKMLFKIVTKSLKSVFQFFTFWALFFSIIFYSTGYKYYQNSMLLISIIVSLYGLIIVYYYPRKIKIPYFGLNIDDSNIQWAKIIDLLSHQLPLLILLLTYDHKIQGDSFLLGLVIAGLYLIFNNPNQIYKFKCNACPHNKKDDIYRCYITCFLINISLILLLIAITVKLILLLKEK